MLPKMTRYRSIFIRVIMAFTLASLSAIGCVAKETPASESPQEDVNAPLPLSDAGGTSSRKAVLLLFPYQENLPQSVLVREAIKIELSKVHDLTIDWYYEYLDLSRFPDADYQQQLADLYATKYRHMPIDLVFLISEPALDYWLQNRAEILPDTPVVFCDITYENLEHQQLPADVTGIISYIDETQFLPWILRADPAISEIVIVQGVGAADQKFNMPLDVLRDSVNNQVSLTNWSHLSLDDIKQRASVLPPKSIIFYQLMFEDGIGTKYRPIDVLDELTEVSSVPVVSKYDHFIGHGTIGGYMYSLEQLSGEAARMGLRILRGEAAAGIPVKEHLSCSFIFDHPILIRYGIPLSALPEGSIIKNRQYTLWEQYRLQTIGISGVATVLVGLVIYLGVLSRRLDTSRQALRRLNANLESQVQERTAEVREKEERYRLLVETSTDVIWTIDETQRFTYISPAIFEMRGLTAEEAMQEAWTDAVYPEFLPRIVESLEKSAAHWAAGNNDFVDRIEIQQPHKDGSRVWTEIIIREFYDAQGDHVGTLGITRNITERKHMEAELIQAKEAAEAANRAKSAFLSNMSHELRTPLNAILGYAQLMTHDPHLTPIQQKHLKTIAHSGEHLLGLINDVLAMSKIEAGRATLQENAFNLHQQLHNLHEMFQVRSDEKGISLLLDIAPGVPRYIYTDEGKLRQILMNLLSNAVKFTQEGGVTLRVRGNNGKEEPTPKHTPAPPQPASYTQILIEVEDTGPGIGPAELETLFDPFVQTSSGQRLQEGTGLGLSISQQFAKLMKGKLTVNSAVGKGTIFRLQIPVVLSDANTVEARNPRPRQRVTGIEPGQVAPDGGPFRILIAEDNPANRELLRKLLSSFEFDIRCVGNGSECVKLWETWRPHLVWMDMRMPVMDGREATRQIRERSAATGDPTTVIALTASAFDEERELVLETGCDDFVRKPFREQEIFDMLQRHLGIRFTYELTTPETPDASTKVSQENLRAVIEKLPATWVKDLHQAIVDLNIDRMYTLVKDISTQDPYLAGTLVQWIDNFEYDKLMVFISGEESQGRPYGPE